MSSLVYRHSTVIAHPEPGWFARTLDHNAPGRLERYEPEPPVRADAARIHAAKARPLVKPDKPLVHNGYPRWTAERLAALPRTSGHITRTDDVMSLPRRGTALVCRCDCGAARCQKRMVVMAAIWARGEVRPKSCKAGARAGSRKPFSEKGYANAREFAAREKEQAA